MKKKIIFLGLVFLAIVNLTTVNNAFASLLPLTEGGLNSANTRTQEREIQNLKNEVYQKKYVDPSTSTARMIMEMSLENAENEKLKEEIKNEINSQNRINQPVKTNEEICKTSIGENSKYNASLKKCECADEYKLYKNKCISKLEYGNEYCKETIGISSKYDSEKDKCLTNEDYCKEKLGYGSRYSIGNEQCECVDGFILTDNVCVEEKKEEVKEESKLSNLSGIIFNFFQKLKFW